METKNCLIMEQPKKLIEVAMPIKEISAESVRDKSIRHGHISTLHLWWARRPLPVCRAVVFASLVPDPLDENCPQQFREAVEYILGKSSNSGDPYKPYEDIPYTAAVDRMDDNLRNRLLMFIGKFSERYILNEKQGIKTDPRDQLNNASLIKWDNKNNDEIINKARELIWVANNADSRTSFKTLHSHYEKHLTDIKEAENDLYSLIDRHLEKTEVAAKEIKLHEKVENFLNRMPKVFDPFAGGGAIPLEAARLGCRSFGNDINPVAHIIQKGSVEFPQKYGKPITYSKTHFINIYGKAEYDLVPPENRIYENGDIIGIRVLNRLSYDVAYYSKMLLDKTEKKVGYLYPADEKLGKPIAYIWSRTATCSNPACKCSVPLLRDFYLCDKPNKKIYLNPIINGRKIEFEIKNGNSNIEGWIQRANLKCPCCGSITDTNTLKTQFKNGLTSERLLCTIYDSTDGKVYRLPTKNEIDILTKISKNQIRPTEKMEVGNNRNFNTPGWGVDEFGQMFSDRQILSMNTLVESLMEIKQGFKIKNGNYHCALVTYLAIFIDRISSRMTSFGLWHTKGEKLEQPFGRQAIPMVFDFQNQIHLPLSGGGALNQLEWLLRYIESEGTNTFSSECIHASSGEKNQFANKYITAVITDPPYYDAIAYADLSDFFYVWLKRTLGDVYPFNFSTPKTPKTEECTALKHHHNRSDTDAKHHFENKLLQIFDAIEYQTSDIVSIMFAHQSTEAWTTLCNSILGSRMNITGSWANDTELTTALKKDMSALSSSVTVACIPSQRIGVGDYKEIKRLVGIKVSEEVTHLYNLGFRGADLLTACFGQAVSEFGKYEKVEKADGNEVTIPELLEMARESAFNALLKGFDGDDFTKFYIGWLQLNGFSETDFDDAAKFARVGLTINVSELFAHNLFIKKGSKQELAGYKERLELNHRIGEGSHSFIIDFVHKAMALYEGANRNVLLEFIAKVAASPDNSFWRVITSLCEILPQGSDDYKQASGILLNKDSLIRESKNLQQSTGEQGQLF